MCEAMSISSGNVLVNRSSTSSRHRPLDSASLFLHFVHDANEFEAQARNYFTYVEQKVSELNEREGRSCLCLGVVLMYPFIGYVTYFIISLPYLRYVKNETICLLVLIILQVIGYLMYLQYAVHRENVLVEKWIVDSQRMPDPNYRSDQILEQLAHERRKKVAQYAKNLGDVYASERCSVVLLGVFLVVAFIGLILLLFGQTFWAFAWLCLTGLCNLSWGKYKLRQIDFGLPKPPEMHREDITKHLVSAQRSWQLAVTDGSDHHPKRVLTPGGPIINEMD